MDRDMLDLIKDVATQDVTKIIEPNHILDCDILDRATQEVKVMKPRTSRGMADFF